MLWNNKQKELVSTGKPRTWIIDPTTQTVTPVDRQDYTNNSLISEIVGVDAFWLKLDNNAVLWCSDVPSNPNRAFYLERMGGPWSVRRYSRGLIVSMGPVYWDMDAIEYYLRWHQRDAWEN